MMFIVIEEVGQSKMYTRILAATFVIAASIPVHAADTLMLECSGTMQIASRLYVLPEKPISIGVIIDMTARTVKASELGGVIPITDVKANKIIFRWTEPDSRQILTWVDGSMDRISGDLRATTWRGYRPRVQGTVELWTLKCHPAPVFRERPFLRMF